jgi:Spx/MgsR family transcriptional regulator
MEIYGISNCDACRRARMWLDETGRDYRWHDLREEGVGLATLREWTARAGLDKLVNRRSTTWRQLDETDRERAGHPETAPALLVDHPTLIKRPVFVIDGDVKVGFNESVKREL